MGRHLRQFPLARRWVVQLSTVGILLSYMALLMFPGRAKGLSCKVDIPHPIVNCRSAVKPVVARFGTLHSSAVLHLGKRNSRGRTRSALESGTPPVSLTCLSLGT